MLVVMWKKRKEEMNVVIPYKAIIEEGDDEGNE